MNLAYSLIFKALLMLLITTFAWISGNRLLIVFSEEIYSPAAFRNVFSQPGGFDYESSHFLKQEIRNTVDCVMEYSLKYMKNYYSDSQTSKQEFDSNMRLSNEGYRNTVAYLESLKGVSFAVVNHDTGIIVSNISELDDSPAGTEIRSFFGNDPNTLIIVRNCKNPYFEQDVMTEYVDYIRERAQQYSDDCDLYISFTEGLEFREDASYYEALHISMTKRVASQAAKFSVYAAITILMIILLIRLSGKAEKNGKIIPGMSDHMPNDLLLIFYAVIGISAIVLFYNSFYMLYKSSTIDSYGLALSPDYYRARANISIVTVVYVLCAAVCKIKRQSRLGTLSDNTCIHQLLCFFKGRKSEK